MFKNIKHNNVRGIKFKLRNDKFYDFMLYRGECVSFPEGYECIVAEIIPDNEKNGKYVSTHPWVNSVNDGIILKNIGYTGVDNGIISFRKDIISNSEFLNLFTNSEYVIEKECDSFFMTPVSGNTGQYKYFSSVEEENGKKYFALKGGFLQGFYKLFGENYQTLPNVIDDEWNFEFVLRRRDYDVHYQTLNHTHPENNGIFFYMGLRAENKFWEKYNVGDKQDLVDKVNDGDDYFIDYDPENENETYHCPMEDYFSSEDSVFCDDIEDGYYEKEISLNDVELKTDSGKNVADRGFYEITTDNKFLTFDHTSNGFTTKTFDENNPYVIFEGKKGYDESNYFVVMNHTSTGMTTETIDEYNYANQKKFDLYQDIKDNAFALKINENGSISYRYAVNDCDSEHGVAIQEETSKENMIPLNKWATINVKIKMLTSNDGCNSKIGKRKMKLYFYVDGNLVFVSKELPEFRFRELDDIKEKQETVPFNISLGGGTQGLVDGIWADFHKNPEYKLPLEKNFCGTFLGDIMSFKFYDCFIDYKTINEHVFKD